jgi:glycolate oxidase FAD binding subunit
VSSVELLEGRLAGLAGRVELARPRFDVEPVPSVAPASVEQVQELLRFAARDRLRVVPCGLGSKLGWCAVPGHVDFLLSARELRRIVSHVPEDGTISVEAGTTMAELASRCRAGGHFLTPDVPLPARRSIGGVIAAGESGRDRLRFGPVRHHVLGLKVVLAGGALARSGGQLVKNVTGFDLHRLYCGSHGTLCVIVEASLRLFPEPEEERLVSAGAGGPAAAFELARRALALPFRPVSLSMRRDATRWTLQARSFGRSASIGADLDALARVWPVEDVKSGVQARAEAERARDELESGRGSRAVLRVATPPSRVEAALAALLAISPELDAAPLAVQPGVAEIELVLAPRDAAGVATAARERLRALGATVALRHAPREALVGLDPFGEPGPGLELMRRLQRKLDPDGVFAAGRFHGGL